MKIALIIIIVFYFIVALNTRTWFFSSDDVHLFVVDRYFIRFYCLWYLCWPPKWHIYIFISIATESYKVNACHMRAEIFTIHLLSFLFVRLGFSLSLIHLTVTILFMYAILCLSAFIEWITRVNQDKNVSLWAWCPCLNLNLNITHIHRWDRRHRDIHSHFVVAFAFATVHFEYAFFNMIIISYNAFNNLTIA